MNKINCYDLKEKVVISVTTDGFLSNVPDLENMADGRFIKIFRSARKNLGEEDKILEIKTIESKGILS